MKRQPPPEQFVNYRGHNIRVTRRAETNDYKFEFFARQPPMYDGVARSIDKAIAKAKALIDKIEGEVVGGNTG